MPPQPLNDRQRRFAQRIAAGAPLGEAYIAAGYTCSESSASKAGSRLSQNPAVIAYISELQAESQQDARFTRADLLRFYEEVIITPPSKVTAESRVAQTYKAVETDKSSTEEIRMVDKIRAADGLRKMLGWDKPTEHNHTVSEPEEVIKKVMFGE